MRVCLICTEFFGWGSNGGFGYATRVIGRELARRGVEVFAVVPQPSTDDRSEIELDGVSIIGIPRTKPFSAAAIYKSIDADIYHSQQPSLASWVAKRSKPGKLHVSTLRDPRSSRDWLQEFRYPTHSKIQVLKTWVYYENILARAAIRSMDALYVPAFYLARKSQGLYSLKSLPQFMPTPVEVPEKVSKAEKPTVCFVGRWDRVKRPEIFFDLANQFPNVQFIAIGRAHNPFYEAELRARYSGQSNLNLVGYIDQFSSNELTAYLEKSWVLVNTSAKEALPNTFVEACANRCAILSALDPDNFASRFGYKVSDDNYAAGLEHLFSQDRWRSLGELGYQYVLQNNSLEVATDKYINEYERLLGRL
ncbi:MAG: glycosyltransferase family 4 protein [Proteobacteria bacterium]|nr:glycosyltransferase family 4 protein [Pseudomonadota bacterium]